MAKQTENTKSNLVVGQVIDKLSRPLTNLIVQAFDRDMRSEELLGEDVTNREGKYEIPWLHSQLKGRGRKEADIAVKVFTKEKKTLVFESDIDSIRFNASPREEINIIIENAIAPEMVEYDYILKEVTFLADKVAITDLQEDKDHQDITFLSKEIEIDPVKIEHFVVAHRLQALSKIDAAFFYALLRKNTLLKNDFSKSFHARLSIGIGTDIQTLLYDAVLTDAKAIEADVKSAVKEITVSSKVSKECKRNTGLLQQFRIRAEEYYKNEHPKKVFDTISRFLLEGKMQEMGKLFQENKNDLNAFFEKITDPAFFSSEAKSTEAKTNIELGQLFGFGSDIIRQVINTKKIESAADIRKLAKLNKSDWVGELTKAKDETALNADDKNAIGLFASAIVRKMEKAYPTMAYTAQLEREKKQVLKNQQNIISFLTNHEDFDLTKHNIDLFLKDNKINDNESTAIKEELKSIQRVFKLVPHYSKTSALLKENIHSAQSIVALGETRFVNEIAPKAGIEPKEAKGIFKKAENINTAAMLIVGELQDTMRGMDVASLETSSMAKKLEAVSKDFPNLKSLFKLTDTCACEHCRSVYSPAAYLVEILEFLSHRSVVDLTIPAPPPPAIRPSVNIAKDVLFKRRPDLGEIDLGCENAETPVKYIDLVCELLEEAIATDDGINYTGSLSDGADPFNGKISATLYNELIKPVYENKYPVSQNALIFKTGITAPATYYLRDKKVVCKIIAKAGGTFQIIRLRQTLSTAEELAASPEYVNGDAYKELSNKSFAFKLPFDLNHAEAKAYFNRFGISRSELMKNFQIAGNPANEAIAAEVLGLTDTERLIIVTPKPNLVDQQLIWNAPAQWDNPPVAGTVLDYMKRVDHFLDKTGLTYKELDLLLTLKFIDPANNLFIKNFDLTCDTEKKEIANLTVDSLDRIHRFLRLQKKTGWKFEVMDEIIIQNKLGNKSLDDACLIKASILLNISEKTGIKIEELIGFYGELPNQILKEDLPKPLYQQVFLNKAKNGFTDDDLLPEKVDGTQLLTTKIPSIAVCLQLKQQDVKKLLPLLLDGNLTFSNLSYLFAASRLIKKLKLKPEDFVILSELTNLNVTDSPQKTFAFVKVVEDLKKSPLKVADIKFMLRHQGTDIPDIDEKIKQILEKLQKDYQNNFALNKSRFDDTLSANEQKEILQTELSKLIGLGEDDIKMLVKFIDRNWVSTASAKGLIDTKFKELFFGIKLKVGPATDTIKNKIDELEAVAATKDQDIKNHEATLLALRTANNDLKKAKTPLEKATANNAIAAAKAQLLITLPKFNVASGKNLLEAILNSISAFQLETGKKNILEQTISAGFKVDLELVKVVLKYAQLKQSAPGNELLSAILMSDDLIIMTGVPPTLQPVTAITFGKQYASIKLLQKLLPLINAFKLSNDQLAWFFENNPKPELSWFEFDSIPYDTGQVAIDYNKYIAFAGMVSLANQFSLVINPADAENPVSFLSTASLLLLPSAPAIRIIFLSSLSLLTGYEKDDLIALDAYLFPAAADLSNYKDLKNWLRLIDCTENLRKLGSDISQIKEYIKPVLLTTDVNILRTALKSRYDEDTWLGTLKEIMDAIRPQKRNALVAYLLSTNPEMKDEYDLFNYFLVDVEMESCMPSSRIVQAHGTIQLFVQRCLMGLEPKAAADLDNDSNWNQWKWMKNYRVWEANRKVFLYPENWIEADLRDDKSFLFTEFENEIQQNELTNFTAEDALTKYLEKLDNIAFLEVMATWYQTDIKTMHIFARTKGGDPAIYYYRRFEKEQYFTPWEKVELDITGDHLLAFVRNNRLSLAWPIFSEEPDPNPKATIPSSNPNTEVPLDKPKRKIKIQLAISEFVNKKWQPKKVSKDAIKTPQDYYTKGDIPKEKFKLFYNQIADQIIVFNTESVWINEDVFKRIDPRLIGHIEGLVEEWRYVEKLSGAFDITGCKGYPELAPSKPFFLNFIPRFFDTELLSQRYQELDLDDGDALSVLNVHAFLSGKNRDQILGATPGTYRITYPHQFTTIDLIVFVFEYFLFLLSRSKLHDRKPRIKIPVGTLLPYFEENSNHAYVIIPGFYKKKDIVLAEIAQSYILTDDEKRTASDIFKLMDDISNFIKKIIIKYTTEPPPDTNTLIHEIIVDEDCQKILKDLTFYEGFDFLYNFLIGKTGNAEIDKVLTNLRDAEGLVYGEQFKKMYHPLICALRSILYKEGIPELMKRETQLQKTNFNFNSYYAPNPLIVVQTPLPKDDGSMPTPPVYTFPIEDLDFSSDGSYSIYNWELFFHVPFLLATRLTQSQRFEEALTWFHYMFNPTGALNGSAPQKYWVTKPFYLNQEVDYNSQRIDALLYTVAGPVSQIRKDLEFAIDQWRNNPFKPHIVAGFRPVAYQKALLMKYIDNLAKWGDYLFRQDTMESIAQATQMYILADKLLGPKPKVIPLVVKSPYETYNQIKSKLDAFGNALIDLENIIPDLSVLPEGGAELPAPPFTLSMLYFCIPQNDKMLEYWDRISDRLFKIRHCQNIDGIERNLALFAPPIDPALLVRAAASGLDISSVLAGLNAPNPSYRFNILSQKATELAQEVRGLGSSLLQILEKKDAEAISLLRSELEIKVLNAVKDIKSLQIAEAKEQIKILQQTRKVTEERKIYYESIEKIIAKEQLNLDKLGEAFGLQIAAQICYTLGGVFSLIPQAKIGVAGFGGSPSSDFAFGGLNLASATKAAGDTLNIFSSAASFEANRASILGNYERRWNDWQLQERLAIQELKSIDLQISASGIRQTIAETDLKNHELQIDNAKKTDEFMRSKFTNKELYDWMIGQISSVYFSAYQLAHDFAKKAERCYRFELGNDDTFISFGYWDSMKKGLQSADHLIHDIKRMEGSYLDKNKREYELTKHVSLAMLDPLALVRLRATGICDFDIPEALYDMDHAGHFFRRNKSVSISLPCITGPYTSVSAKLSLVNNKYRKNTNPAAGYAEDPGNDDRFIYNVGAIQSIAASNSQNDSGIFELNFRDERYLPFEGTGAISSWRLELPTEIKQFDYNTISDVIIHVKYTAREGGSGLKSLANASLKDRLALISQKLSQEGLHIAINMKHDLSNEWHLFKQNGKVDLKFDKSRLPYMAQTLDAKIEDVIFIAKAKNIPATFSVIVDGLSTNLALIDEWKLYRGINSAIDLDTVFSIAFSQAQLNNLEELLMIVKYSF